MVSAIMGGISAAMGLVSSAVSAYNQGKASDEIRAKNAILDQQRLENEALFNRQYYSDITKRTDIQNMLRILDENQRNADKRSEALAAIGGATPEQQLASREINRRTYADALAEIASNANTLKDQYMREYQRRRDADYASRLGLQNELAGIYSNTANQWATASTNAFKGGADMLANGDYSNLGNGTKATPDYTSDTSVVGGIKKGRAKASTAYLQKTPSAQNYYDTSVGSNIGAGRREDELFPIRREDELYG